MENPPGSRRSRSDLGPAPSRRLPVRRPREQQPTAIGPASRDTEVPIQDTKISGLQGSKPSAAGRQELQAPTVVPGQVRHGVPRTSRASISPAVTPSLSANSCTATKTSSSMESVVRMHRMLPHQMRRGNSPPFGGKRPSGGSFSRGGAAASQSIATAPLTSARRQIVRQPSRCGSLNCRSSSTIGMPSR